MTALPHNATVGWLRPTSVGGLLVVVASIVTSAAAHRLLEKQLRIRWTVGSYQHYGPEHAPTAPTLIAFPIALAAAFVGFRALGARLEALEDLEDVDAFRTGYEIVVLSTLVALIGAQLALVAANLYL